jgi:hypothetical protein
MSAPSEKTLLKQLFAFVSTNDWYLDPYKISGLLCIGVSIGMGIWVFVHAAVLEASKLGVLSGITLGIGGFASVLFAQARINDNHSSPNGPNGPVGKKKTGGD